MTTQPIPAFYETRNILCSCQYQFYYKKEDLIEEEYYQQIVVGEIKTNKKVNMEHVGKTGKIKLLRYSVKCPSCNKSHIANEFYGTRKESNNNVVVD